MSIDYLEGFAFEPGANAYLGRNYFEFVAIHFTAGACGGDRSVGLRGYFNAYIPRGDDCGPGATQFAGMDRINWHACEWNVRGPGIEFEKLNNDVALTQYQLDKGRSAFQQLIAAGIAPTYRDTPGDRIPVGGDISGFVTHRTLHENLCDEHYDGLPQEEIDYMMAPAPIPQPLPPKRFDEMYIALLGADRAFQVQDNYPVEIPLAVGQELAKGGIPKTVGLNAQQIYDMAVRYERLHPEAAAIAKAIKQA